MRNEVERLEAIILGSILNDNGSDGFIEENNVALKADLFTGKKNAFLWNVLERMSKDGQTDFTPYSVLRYCDRNDIKYGDLVNFCEYMIELSTDYYAHIEFSKYVDELIESKERAGYGN